MTSKGPGRARKARAAGVSKGASAREDILAAAGRVLRREGLAATTTRKIAHEAGCADGAIFYYFPTRLDLLVAMLLARAPDGASGVDTLPLSVGERTVEENLATVLREFLGFHLNSVPILGSLFSEPELLARYRAELKRLDRGPHLSRARIAAYVRAEQRLGRVAGDRDPIVVADLVVSASFQRAFRACFLDDPVEDPLVWSRACARELVYAAASSATLPVEPVGAPHAPRPKKPRLDRPRATAKKR